jgi:hypothetical protein
MKSYIAMWYFGNMRGAFTGDTGRNLSAGTDPDSIKLEVFQGCAALPRCS